MGMVEVMGMGVTSGTALGMAVEVQAEGDEADGGKEEISGTERSQQAGATTVGTTGEEATSGKMGIMGARPLVEEVAARWQKGQLEGYGSRGVVEVQSLLAVRLRRTASSPLEERMEEGSGMEKGQQTGAAMMAVREQQGQGCGKVMVKG